jgi:hypothetical protein
VKRAAVVTATLAVTLAGTPAEAQTSEPVRAVFRIFNGTDEVTADTRVRVRVSGRGEEDVGVVLNGPALSADLAPGIYDAQAILHRAGRVLSVRWAERLVIVRYPDEGAEHLEVINFAPNFGALQLRLPEGTRPDPPLVRVEPAGEAAEVRARVHPGQGYLLVVAPAGTYTIGVALPAGPVTLPAVEIPGDRTRLHLVGAARP